MLKVNTSIKIASLRKCNLSSFALVCLCKAFETNTTLELLNLEENNFDDQAILTLSKSTQGKKLRIILTSNFLTIKSRDILKNMDNIALT